MDRCLCRDGRKYIRRVNNLWDGGLIPNKKQEARSLELLKKYGPITLLFSWLPIVGDGFCLGAGWLRINFWRSFLLILLGKFVRYLVLAAVSLHMFS